MRITLKNKSEWHRCFVWLPVQIGNELVWLDWVERKSVYVGYAIDDIYGLHGPREWVWR